MITKQRKRLSGLRFEFCSIKTLKPRVRKYIKDKMTWKNGSMQFWLSERHQNRRLCLIYDNGALVTWACIGLDDLDVSSWTLKGYRKRGYAQASIWALLNREKTSRRSRLWTYSPSTCRIVRRLGYKSTYKV